MGYYHPIALNLKEPYWNDEMGKFPKEKLKEYAIYQYPLLHKN